MDTIKIRSATPFIVSQTKIFKTYVIGEEKGRYKWIDHKKIKTC